MNCFFQGTLNIVGKQSAGPQWQSSDKADARPLRYADIQREVLYRLPGPHTQSELIASESTWQELLVRQREGHTSPRRHIDCNTELLDLTFPSKYKNPFNF